MGTLFSYSLLSAVVIALMFGAYKLFLSREKNLHFNRIVFLSIYIVSLLMPLWWMTAIRGSEMIRETAMVVTTGAPAAMESDIVDPSINPSYSISGILLWLYMTGVLVVLAHMVVVTVRIMRIVRSGERISYGRYTVVLIDNPRIAPFSWINCMVMSRSDYYDCGGMIMKHEMVHIRSCHWIDLYAAQLFVVFQWYNPVVWLMRTEIRTLHEFEADDAVISSGVPAYDYQMLLVKKAVGARFPSLADSLNHSQLKKRVNMMSQKSSSRWSAMRSLAFVPALALAALVYSTPAVASFIDSTSQSAISLPDDKGSEKRQLSLTKKSSRQPK